MASVGTKYQPNSENSDFANVKKNGEDRKEINKFDVGLVWLLARLIQWLYSITGLTIR